MNDKNEFTREDIRIDPDMEVDCDVGEQITAYVELWFDADKKFGTHTAEDDDSWVNMYARFNVPNDTLTVECEVYHDNGSELFDYEPTAAEAELIKEMIREACLEYHHCKAEELIGQCNALEMQ